MARSARNAERGTAAPAEGAPRSAFGSAEGAPRSAFGSALTMIACTSGYGSGNSSHVSRVRYARTRGTPAATIAMTHVMATSTSNTVYSTVTVPRSSPERRALCCNTRENTTQFCSVRYRRSLRKFVARRSRGNPVRFCGEASFCATLSIVVPRRIRARRFAPRTRERDDETTYPAGGERSVRAGPDFSLRRRRREASKRALGERARVGVP